VSNAKFLRWGTLWRSPQPFQNPESPQGEYVGMAGFPDTAQLTQAVLRAIFRIQKSIVFVPELLSESFHTSAWV
jgi:hypothetical protein